MWAQGRGEPNLGWVFQVRLKPQHWEELAKLRICQTEETAWERPRGREERMKSRRRPVWADAARLGEMAWDTEVGRAGVFCKLQLEKGVLWLRQVRDAEKEGAAPLSL